MQIQLLRVRQSRVVVRTRAADNGHIEIVVAAPGQDIGHPMPNGPFAADLQVEAFIVLMAAPDKACAEPLLRLRRFGTSCCCPHALLCRPVRRAGPIRPGQAGFDRHARVKALVRAGAYSKAATAMSVELADLTQEESLKWAERLLP